MTPPSLRLSALSLALLALVPLARGENDTTNLIDGVVSNFSGATLNIGNTGTSNVLLVVNGGVFSNIGTAFIGNASGASNNSALVAGAGSLWQLNNALTIGANAGGNSLTVSNGGAVVVGNAIYVGSNLSVRGSILLDAGTLVATNGALNLGYYGAGSMSVLNGGSFLVNGLFLGAHPFGTLTNDLTILGGTNQNVGNTQVGVNRSSYLTLDGGVLLATNSGTSFIIANGGASSGTVTVAGGAFMANNLVVGGLNGAQGLLNILGGTNVFTGTVTLGNNGGSVGRMLVGGGLVTVTNPNLVVGNAGTGNLTLSNGTLRTSGITLGNLGGGTGILHVAGGTLTVTNASGNATLLVGQAGLGIYTQTAGNVSVDLLVGTNGNNTVFRFHGGTFTVGYGSTLTNGSSAEIGGIPGENATVSLLGATNNWYGPISIGKSGGGTGTLVVAGGSFNLTSSISVGGTGAGSLIISNGNHGFNSLVVGSSAGSEGSWTMLGGTSRVSSTITLGSLAGSTGHISLASTLLVATNGQFTIGTAGAGTLVTSNTTLLGQVIQLGSLSGGSGSWIALGGTNQLNQSLLIGNGNNSRGVATLSNSTTTVGFLTRLGSNAGATGILAIVGGSLWLSNSVDIGRGAGGYGEFLLDGGASLTTTTSVVNVGNSGRGLMTLSNGNWLGRSLVVGSNAGAFGTLAINGGTSQLGGNLVVGNNAGATGVVLVSGGSLTLTNGAGDGSLVIGRGGLGVYTQDAGNVTVDRLFATNGANSVFAVNGGAFTVLHGATSGAGSPVVLGTNGPGSATLSLLADSSSFGDHLLVGKNGTLLVSNASLNVAGWVTNSGTLRLANATVTFQKPVSIDGGFANDLSTATFKTNLAVAPSGWLAGASGGVFALEKDFVMQSTNLGQFNLAYSTVLFTNGPAHTLNLAGSGALDLTGLTNFAQAGSNFGIGRLSIATGDTLTLTGTKTLSLTNALFVGFLDIQGLGSAPYLTNSFLDVSNTLASVLSLPDINLYFDPNDTRNSWLVNNMPDGGYNFWGGGSLSTPPLAIPEPSAVALALLGAGAFVCFRRGPKAFPRDGLDAR